MPICSSLYTRRHKPKILLLGSGALSIGQAGEFDYSGTQAKRALLEEGFEVVVVNPNIATVQTDIKDDAKVYLYPVRADWVEKIIEEERPDGIIGGFGGQSALNCLLELERKGVLQKYDVTNLGTSCHTLRLTEDRELFARRMRELSIPIPTSVAAETLGEAVRAAESIGFPVIVRAAYALGGLGSGFARDEAELRVLVEGALSTSPQVLIETSLRGWKEVEYEVMRDGAGNVITICNMENIDPLGIHTGDSIVVAPSQTLSDAEYQLLRNAAIRVVSDLEVVGECNVQFALNPSSLEYVVIEVNARLSRSSALASKATGYPIAWLAAKVVLGYDLLELKNPVTGTTSAFFEPALDYVTLKIPRWDLCKFKSVERKLSSAMKSVGEVMAIGRTLPEAMQKAVRMVSEESCGLSELRTSLSGQELREALVSATDQRLFCVFDALRHGFSVEEICELTSIDAWFICNFKEIVDGEERISSSGSDDVEQLGARVLREWKKLGFGDEQIAYLMLCGPDGGELKRTEIEKLSHRIRKRRESVGVRPVVKRIDTTAGEHPSASNYLYVSYCGEYDEALDDDGASRCAIVLGSGPYRIGSSVEFDWSAVHASQTLRELGWRSVVINCNPETVSTDYDASSRLYFEELTCERVLDILAFERASGVVTCMGGQVANNLAGSLARAGVSLFGHPADAVDAAEDRRRFSSLLDGLGLRQPRWTAATSESEIDAFISTTGFPVIVRPSYVLSGAAMRVAFDRATLEECLADAHKVSPEFPVVVSQFVSQAREVELDAVAQGGELVVSVVSEHIEDAGTHSGDATVVLPARTLSAEIQKEVVRIGEAVAKALALNGPFNIQYLVKDNFVYVIECNARAARSFPFVSKVTGVDFAAVATRAAVGDGVKTPIAIREQSLSWVGVKSPMFSFNRLIGCDPVPGVEMASTGEAACLADDFGEALLLAMESTNVRAPRKGVLVSAGTPSENERLLKVAGVFEKLGAPVYATVGTSVEALELIRSGKVDLVINIPKNLHRKELNSGTLIRQCALRFGCSLLVNMELVEAFLLALEARREAATRSPTRVSSLNSFHSRPL